MGSRSKIEWLEGGATWNFLYGCTKVASGCANCYAERVTPRLGVRGVGPVMGTGDTGPANFRGSVIFREDHLEDPLHWQKGRKVFVNSLSDTFHEKVPESLHDRMMDVALRARQHTYLMLTKRPERMASYLRSFYKRQEPGLLSPWPEIWGGCSLSKVDEWRGVEEIRSAPLAKRFLSIEPLLEPVDVRGMLTGIHWVIVGGESGRLARPCQEKWVRAIVKACRAAQVPVFVKQMGAWWAHELGQMIGPNTLDTKGSQPYAWPKDLQVREVPRG